MAARFGTSLGCFGHGSFPEVCHAARHGARVSHVFPQHRHHRLSLAAMSVQPKGGTTMSPAVTPGQEQTIEVGPMTAEAMTRLTSTLDGEMATLQTVVGPGEDSPEVVPFLGACGLSQRRDCVSCCSYRTQRSVTRLALLVTRSWPCRSTSSPGGNHAMGTGVCGCCSGVAASVCTRSPWIDSRSGRHFRGGSAGRARRLSPAVR